VRERRKLWSVSHSSTLAGGLPTLQEHTVWIPGIVMRLCRRTGGTCRQRGIQAMVDFDRSVLGVESAPIRYDVEKGAIRKFVEAIGDEDPIYRDEQAAQAAGFMTIVAPPTFLCTFRAQELPDLKITFGRVRLNGGNAYEYYKPVYAGDTITVTAKYANVSERTGRTGSMVFVFTDLTFANQHGEVVATGRNTGIMRE
jgi:acyl dehydratase